MLCLFLLVLRWDVDCFCFSFTDLDRNAFLQSSTCVENSGVTRTKLAPCETVVNVSKKRAAVRSHTRWSCVIESAGSFNGRTFHSPVAQMVTSSLISGSVTDSSYNLLQADPLPSYTTPSPIPHPPPKKGGCLRRLDDLQCALEVGSFRVRM